MLFSPFQIESMLEDLQKNISSPEKYSSDLLSISEDAYNEARQYTKERKDFSLKHINSNKISDLVEDKTLYDPIIDYVQQSRAGRFVIPNYKPENTPPKFPLVRKFSAEGTSRSENYDENIKLPNEKYIANGNDEEKETLDSKKYSFSDSKKYTKIFSDIEKEDFKKDPIFSREITSHIDYDNDIVFGEGPVIDSSISKFLREYPESAIKFLLRKNLDGRPLPIEYNEIYRKWEKRGLSKGKLKKYLLELMHWKEFPDIPVIEILRSIRENIFDIKEKKE